MDHSKNRIYVGAVNHLYDLSSDGLSIHEHAITGPRADSILCAGMYLYIYFWIWTSLSIFDIFLLRIMIHNFYMELMYTYLILYSFGMSFEMSIWNLTDVKYDGRYERFTHNSFCFKSISSDAAIEKTISGAFTIFVVVDLTIASYLLSMYSIV